MKPKNCLGWLSSSQKGGNAGAYHLWRWDSSLITAQLVHYVSVGVWVLCHQSMFSGGMNEATAIQIIKSYLSMPTHRDMLLPTMGMVDQWLGDFVLMPLCPSLEWVGWCSIGTLYVPPKKYITSESLAWSILLPTIGRLPWWKFPSELNRLELVSPKLKVTCMMPC